MEDDSIKKRHGVTRQEIESRTFRFRDFPQVVLMSLVATGSTVYVTLYYNKI